MNLNNPELDKVIKKARKMNLDLTLNQAGLVAAGKLTLEEIENNPKLGLSNQSARETYKGY